MESVLLSWDKSHHPDLEIDYKLQLPPFEHSPNLANSRCLVQARQTAMDVSLDLRTLGT